MLGWLSSIGDAISTFLSFASSMLSGILSVFGLVGTCFSFLSKCFAALPTPLLAFCAAGITITIVFLLIGR